MAVIPEPEDIPGCNCEDCENERILYKWELEESK